MMPKAFEKVACNVEVNPSENHGKNGVVIMATIGTYGDTVHTFVERKNYHGEFLPNFHRLTFKDPLEDTLPPTKLGHLDHIVGNQPDLELTQICEMWVIFFFRQNGLKFYYCFRITSSSPFL